MKNGYSRRRLLAALGKSLGALGAAIALHPARSIADKITGARKTKFSDAAPDYDPKQHRWQYAIDIDKCIGCGNCVAACKNENKVIDEPFYFRTWVERYVLRRSEPGSIHVRGETAVDSPNGGMAGFPPVAIPKENVLRTFFVPKLCNHCVESPCTQACPVGATFDSPDGVVLVDPSYCIGCGFCIQTCPYGCRFLNPITKTAEKCTFCYHRITRGLKPACVEVCPTGARMFGDLKNPVENDPIQTFIEKNKVNVLKPHLNTRPQVLYTNLDKDVN